MFLLAKRTDSIRMNNMVCVYVTVCNLVTMIQVVAVWIWNSLSEVYCLVYINTLRISSQTKCSLTICGHSANIYKLLFSFCRWQRNDSGPCSQYIQTVFADLFTARIENWLIRLHFTYSSFAHSNGEEKWLLLLLSERNFFFFLLIRNYCIKRTKTK